MMLEFRSKTLRHQAISSGLDFNHSTPENSLWQAVLLQIVSDAFLLIRRIQLFSQKPKKNKTGGKFDGYYDRDLKKLNRLLDELKYQVSNPYFEMVCEFANVDCRIVRARLNDILAGRVH